MTDSASGDGFIDAASIATEEALADLLFTLGFRSQPISRESADIRLPSPHGDLPPVRRLLSWQDNPGFESYAIVAAEAGALRIHYYQLEDDNFGLWDTYSGRVSLADLKRSIRSATTEKDIELRLGYFWPTHVQTDQALDAVLRDIGLKPQDARWPAGLPEAGQSVNIPHRLVAGTEHGLETDALVSIDGDTVYIYYRDPAGTSYHKWAELRARERASGLPEVRYSLFYDALISAMRASKQTETFAG